MRKWVRTTYHWWVIGNRRLAKQQQVKREELGGCPIRTLCDKLNRRGWTVAMPFPIPDACHARTCGHTSDDAWALDYAARAQRVTRGVEDGRYTFEDVQAFTATVFRDGLPEEVNHR